MHVTVLYNPGTGTQANRHELDGNHDLRTVFLYWQGLLGFQDTERMIYTIAGQDDIDLSELPADTLVSSVLVKNAVISITERTQIGVTVVYGKGYHRYELRAENTLRVVFLYWKDRLGFQDTERMSYTVLSRDGMNLGEKPRDTIVSSVLVEDDVISIAESAQTDDNATANLFSVSVDGAQTDDTGTGNPFSVFVDGAQTDYYGTAYPILVSVDQYQTDDNAAATPVSVSVDGPQTDDYVADDPIPVSVDHNGASRHFQLQRGSTVRTEILRMKNELNLPELDTLLLTIENGDNSNLLDLPSDTRVSEIFFENAVLNIFSENDDVISIEDQYMPVTVIYNGASHHFELRRGAAVHVECLRIKDWLGLPELDTLLFTIVDRGDASLVDLPANTLVSNVFSEGDVLNIAAKRVHVIVVYNGATHRNAFRIGASVQAVLLAIKVWLGLPELDTLRFNIAGRDNTDLVDLPADTFVSSVFVENDVLNITDKDVPVTVVYDGATHHVELKIGAIVHAELLRIKNRFGLAELGTMRFTIENGDNADLVDLPADTLVSSVFVENDVLNITDKNVHVTVIYNGGTRDVYLTKGVTVHAALLGIKDWLGLPELDTLLFAIEKGGNSNLVDLPSDVLVSSILSKNDVLNITDKHFHVSVVYNGATHPCALKIGATIQVEFFRIKDELGLPELDKLRFTIAGREDNNLGELPADTLVSSVFFEHAIMNIKLLKEKGPIRNMLADAVRNPIRTMQAVTTVVSFLDLIELL